MAAHRIYHWKHGWIPLTHTAALSKAHGSEKGAHRELSKSVAAGHAHPSALKGGSGGHGGKGSGGSSKGGSSAGTGSGGSSLRPVDQAHFRRSPSIVVAHDERSGNFILSQGGKTMTVSQELAEHLERRGLSVSFLLHGDGKIVAFHPDGGGALTFKADGSDRLAVDPLGGRHDNGKPRPAFAQRIDALRAQLPQDRDGLKAIGIRDDVFTAEEQRAQDIRDAEKMAGGTLEELDAKIEAGKRNLETWRALYDAADEHPGIYDARKWPDDLLPYAKEAGFARRQPRLVLGQLYDAIRQQDDAVYRMEGRRHMHESNLAHLENRDYVDDVRKADDLTPTGELGADTRKALHTTLEAGRILDDEVERRLSERVNARPDAQAELDAVLRKANALLNARAAAYAAGDDDEFARIGAELDPIRRHRDALLSETARARIERRQLYAETVREVLAEARPMGGKGSAYRAGNLTLRDAVENKAPTKRTHSELVKMMEDAHANFPSDWLEHARIRNPEVDLVWVNRGYNSRGDRIALSDGKNNHVATHELGHSMELAVPGLQNLEWAFHYSRSSSVGADGIRRLDAAEPLAGYVDERGQKDEWATHYTGKVYESPTNLGAKAQYEVFTTGIESVFSGSPYFDRGGQNKGADDEFRRFMLGVLSVL